MAGTAERQSAVMVPTRSAKRAVSPTPLESPPTTFSKRVSRDRSRPPTRRPSTKGVQVDMVEFQFDEVSWEQRRGIVGKIERHVDEIFPRFKMPGAGAHVSHNPVGVRVLNRKLGRLSGKRPRE